jgi:putative FmdB family regulatory protein
MPLYDYKCYACTAKREVVLRLAELDEAVVKCLTCGCAMTRQISAPMVLGDYPGYDCPVTGKWIEGRRAHIENLARTGCRLLEPGEREANVRARRADDEALDRAVEETVDRHIAGLPTAERDCLAGALENGLDAQIVRSAPTE